MYFAYLTIKGVALLALAAFNPADPMAAACLHSGAVCLAVAPVFGWLQHLSRR